MSDSILKKGGPYFECRELFAFMASKDVEHPYVIQAANSDACGVVLRVMSVRTYGASQCPVPLMQVRLRGPARGLRHTLCS